jgi:AAA+ superfamily predicted ATPase
VAEQGLEEVNGWAALATALVERELFVVERPDEQLPAEADAAVVSAEEALRAEVETAEDAFAGIVLAAELDEAEARVLAVVAGIDLDRRLGSMVGRLTARPADPRPSVDLLARLLGGGAVAALAPTGRLSRAALLDVEEGVALASARVAVHRSVAWTLLDQPALDPDLPHGVAVVAAGDALGGPRLALVHGDDRQRRLQTAVAVTWGLGFVVAAPPAAEAGWRALVRQATLLGAGVVLDLTAPPDELTRHWVERADHLSWALCSREPLPLETLPDVTFTECEAGDRHVSPEEWLATLPGHPVPARRPTATQLDLLRRVHAPAGVPPMRRLAAGSLLKHARRVTPSKTWDDLVLPPAQERRLRELVARYRHRSRVHEEWGLDLFPSPGVVALFSGPSGTGKTTSAEVLAGELGVELFRVDLSALVSKYIGETEKNLEEIFSAAHAGDYLLLFDEADSLFGQRSAVSDARDRYANMEVSYLLQRLETYDGFVVLTSNFQGNIDDAFLRRIHASVHFPVPSPADRERMWSRSLADAPLDEVDLPHLAKTFELAGGAIRNAALTAAFLAADRGRSVGMPELLTAVVQEMTKLKQRVTPDMLGPWADQVDRG